jgi:hypothetical protein
MNILIKLTSIVSLVIAPTLASIHHPATEAASLPPSRNMEVLSTDYQTTTQASSTLKLDASAFASSTRK